MAMIYSVTCQVWSLFRAVFDQVPSRFFKIDQRVNQLLLNSGLPALVLFKNSKNCPFYGLVEIYFNLESTASSSIPKKMPVATVELKKGEKIATPPVK